MISTLQSINVVYHMYWFAYIEPSWHPRNKLCLIMVYNPIMWWDGWWFWRNCFVGTYCVSRICLEFPTLEPQAAFCKLKSVTDLQLGPARFPVTVTTVYRGVEGKLCTSLFLCNWLVFLTICKPSTAKRPWLHKPPGGYTTHLLTLIGAPLSVLSLLRNYLPWIR
jgi:hypothetical protein